jgi:hypothetical protein
MAALAFGGAAPALAATHKTKHATKKHARKHNTNSSGSGETALTGATLTSASNAALAANSGATVVSASTETDSSVSGAAYEVHITKSDGSKAVVIEGSSFTVLATKAESHGGSSNGETALTGATLTSASNAALAGNSGATVDSATTETDSSLSGAAYEVHITKSDGSKAVVIEDSSFTVLATQTGGGCHGGGGPHAQ